jgi:hypothetical protein
VPPTSTALADKAHAKVIDPRELVADPESFIGENVVLNGYARNVQTFTDGREIFGLARPSFTWTDFLATVPNRPGLLSQGLAVYFFPKNSKVLIGNDYRLWAIVRGTEETVIVQTGATHTVPDVEVYAWLDTTGE